ncbi:hypothetical protein [Streptomyces sulphureus]|uniref:hypothetical protein n=1 Tax=Streptomyces sulphureus TaxID=47758 RepID=UPI00131A0FD9|nr:hypothetical protein [Streptomyces sulphureus]
MSEHENVRSPVRYAEHLLLPDETPEEVGQEAVERRDHILGQLRALPDEAFTTLQYLQPQVGCFNRCVFCSQHAGTDVWQLTRRGLRDLFAALSGALRERPHLKGEFTGARPHKPRVLFPYTDNDIASYAHLDHYIELARDVMQCRTRLTTVGYSSRNERLAAMHRRISAELAPAVYGMRLSATPFAHGWSAGDGKAQKTSRRDFVADFTEALRTYRPLLEQAGAGKDAVCVELRFRPLAVRAAVTDTVLDGHHVLASGPHLLVSRDPVGGPPRLAHITGIGPGGAAGRYPSPAADPEFSEPPSPYLLATSDALAAGGAQDFLRRVRAGEHTSAELREVEVYRLTNRDGPYYAIDPRLSGSLRPLQLYPETDRRAAGYNDASRHFLRTLVDYKAQHGAGRREELVGATVRDVARALYALRVRARKFDAYDARAAAHVREEILPMVRVVAGAILSAGLPPALFFSRRFTLDTGQAANHGRARALFKGLAGTEDEPMSPWEERSNHISVAKGHVWRLAPVPFSPGASADPGAARRGGKNGVAGRDCVVVQEMDARYVQPVDHRTGQRLREFRIDGVETEHLPLREGLERRLLPGVRGTAAELPLLPADGGGS